MRVDLGSRVKSRDGQDIGVVKHLIVDPEDNRVRAVVLEQGFILTQDSIVPIEELSLTPGNEVQINRLASEVHDLARFHSSDFTEPNYPDVDPDAPKRYGLPLAGVLWPSVNPYPGSITGQGGYGAFPLFVPMGDMQEGVPVASVDREEVTVPTEGGHTRENQSHLSAISRGSDVIAMNGDKVGEVQDVEFDGMSGRPMSVVINRGVLFTERITLPADKIASVTDGAVNLNIDEEELKKWGTAPSVPYV
jgi:uncharacterized protein YrrD